VFVGALEVGADRVPAIEAVSTPVVGGPEVLESVEALELPAEGPAVKGCLDEGNVILRRESCSKFS
jgi:hypothetical protein